MASLAERIEVERFSGLVPRAWICVGSGFSREEIKRELLSRGRGFICDAVTNLQEICCRLARVRDDRVLGSSGRQEVLRMLLSEPRVSSSMLELKRLRRQGAFFRRLDQAIQAGRLAFAHEEERAVYAERLEARFGPSPLRREVEALARGYEAFLDEKGLVDGPILLSRATARLAEGWPEEIVRPESIEYFSIQRPESRETAFWEALRAHVDVAFHGAPEKPASSQVLGQVLGPGQTRWERWHTADDATESLTERLSALPAEKLSRQTVLIPDSSAVRRSFTRAARECRLPLADPRDPTRLAWDEAVKWAMLPLRVVAGNFERSDVLEYLRTYEGSELVDFARIRQETWARGIRMGLSSYSGGALMPAHARLSRLLGKLGGKKTCDGAARAHLELLREKVAGAPGAEALHWVLGFFEQIWTQFIEDMARVGRDDVRAPALFWAERLRERVAEAPAPVERLKPEHGVAAYRFNQAPLADVDCLWILVPETNALGGPIGDYWYTEREREILAAEFNVRGSVQVREERLACLRAWIGSAREVILLDSVYEPDGREREELLPFVREVFADNAPGEAPEEMGAHPRWSRSFSPFRPVPPQKVQLPPLHAPEISATAVDEYSVCPFLALSRQRWKLWDEREPDTELAGYVRGNLLHQAVRLLLASRSPDGQFQLDCAEALERAWREHPPRGLIRGRRIERYAKARLVDVLRGFAEEEMKYAARSGTRVLNMEDRHLKLDLGEIAVVGTPDRIDEHPEGLFVMDYKTSSALPYGCDMVELGYRLQLPFYALALAHETKRAALGVQFIELSRSASNKRTHGIFFKKLNGKQAGALTDTRSKKNVFEGSPDEIWASLRGSLETQARAYAEGRFDASPKKRKDCESCFSSDLCGFRRGPRSDAESGDSDD